MPTDRRGQIDVLALIDHFVLGGAETLLPRFAAAAPQYGIRLSIACLQELDGNPAAAPLVDLGTPPFNLNLLRRPGPREFRSLRQHVAQSGAQIVHTHLGLSDLLGGVVARSLGIPMVSTIHTTMWGTSRRTLVERQIIRSCADRIIAVSESARQEYLTRGWATERQIVTVHNGVDLAPEPGAGVEVRRELGLDPDDQVVMMVSALRPEKAHDVAIDAIRILRPQFPKLRLVIAGQGQLREHLSRRAADMDGSVVIAGLRPDIMRVLDAADICLHPSRREALPTTILEAMAASVPVIATAVGGIPEIVQSEEEGLLVPGPPEASYVSAALSSLLRNPSRRRAMGAAGRKVYAARFTAEPWVQATRRVYDEILTERARQRCRRGHGTHGLVTRAASRG